MAELSNAEAALLGLLAEKPMHPYQIEGEVRYRDMRFWTELSMSSIYKLLRKLEKNGFVLRANQISKQNRVRKVYAVSKRGRKALSGKLENLLSEPEHVRWRVDIGTYNCDLLTADKTHEALQKYRKTLEDKSRAYKDLLKFLRDSGCPAHRFAVATRPMFLIKGEIHWIDSFMAQLEDK